MTSWLAEVDHEILKMDAQNEEEGEMKTAQVEIAEDEVELINLTDLLTVVSLMRSKCLLARCQNFIVSLLVPILNI